MRPLGRDVAMLRLYRADADALWFPRFARNGGTGYQKERGSVVIPTERRNLFLIGPEFPRFARNDPRTGHPVFRYSMAVLIL